MVYIKEAHPDDGWQVPTNRQQGIVFNEPKTREERSHIATTCATRLALKIPFVVDEIDNKVESAYAAWPDRIYIVDKNGRVAFKGAPGPRGFKADEMAVKLDEILKADGQR